MICRNHACCSDGGGGESEAGGAEGGHHTPVPPAGAPPREDPQVCAQPVLSDALKTNSNNRWSRSVNFFLTKK